MLGPYYVNTEARRIQAWGQPCQVPFAKVTIDGRQISVHRDVVQAFEAWEDIRARHHYRLDGNDTGAYNCRRINHNPANPWSAHAWATAMDINWLTNPAGSKLVTDMPPRMVDEGMRLKTNSGAFVFMWGGDWDRNPDTPHSFLDAMHWEVIAHPLDLASGIAGSPPKEVHMGLKAGDRSNAVRALQRHLADWSPTLGIKDDGIYGNHTTAAVKTYQMAAGLPDTGEADDTTLIHVYTNALRNVESYKRTLERMGL